MDRSFDSEIDLIKKHVLEMGGHVEEALRIAALALTKRNASSFEEVHKIEEKINQEHIRLDDECLRFLAKQGPVAKDLRFIFSLIKINADLERMGDQTVNIAYTGRDYLQRAQIDAPIEIEEMSQIASKMVRESLDCFVREDVEQAKKILILDDEVDKRKNQVFSKLTQYMREKPEHIESALDLILIARNLERLGDHATNIAEDVIFVSTGKDIRHGGKQS